MSKITQHTRMQNRNRRLVARFYFYSNIIGLKFSRVMQHLEAEFDISEGRICDIISDCNEWVNALEKKQISTSQLKDHYPFMTWSYAPAKRCQNANQLHLNLF